MHKTIIGLVAVCFALASCQTGSIDTTLQQSLPKTCALISTGHAAFVVVAATGQIKKKTVATELAAYNSVQPICADPANATATDALLVAASAYATISAALTSARGKKKRKA